MTSSHQVSGSLPGLAGSVAIVTGHKGGIGAAVYKLLQEQGAHVHGFDLPEVDLKDFASIERHVKTVADQHGGRIDILINNAGITGMGSLLEVSLEEIDTVFAVNVKAPILLIKAVLPHMLPQKKGAIVNNASDQALVGKRYSAVYGASKAAIAQLTKSATLDWAAHGIRFNCVAPGSTDTAMLRQVFHELHSRYPDIYPAEVDDFYRAGIPMKRFADPREIAWLMAFLASDAASFITGAVIPIDGGFTAA